MTTQATTTAHRAWPFRYEAIDGLRGLAALAVVAHHLLIAPLGHHAVMLFFVISGYCIAAAVESGRRRQMSFGAFMRRRFHRIYPPYFFALLFFVATRLVKGALGERDTLSHSGLDWLLNLTLTQWLALPLHPVADAPQNPHLFVAAFWSLNYEEQFYLVMAGALSVCAIWRLPPWLPVIVLTVGGLVWNCATPGGWITGFFLEYWVHFSLGALLFYALCLYPATLVRWVFLAAVTVLGLYAGARLWLARPGTLADLRVYTEFAVVCGFTLFLYFFRPFSAAVSRSLVWRPIAGLGTISYSLYLIHQFNLTVVTELTDWLLAPQVWESVRASVMLALEVALASLFWYFCERPFLNRAGRGGAPPQPGQHATERAALTT